MPLDGGFVHALLDPLSLGAAGAEGGDRACDQHGLHGDDGGPGAAAGTALQDEHPGNQRGRREDHRERERDMDQHGMKRNA